jgi:tetratricopeptide (TPR) repeat protein
MLLSQVYLLYKKQHEQALAEGERAITLDPNNADGYARMGLVLINAGQPEKAIGVIGQAMRLNPHHPAWYSYWLGVAYSSTRRFEEAIATLKRATTASPNFLGPHLSLASIYSRLGQEEEARAEAAEVLRISPYFSLEGFGQRLSFRDPAAVEREIAALRKAGLK